MKKYTKEVFYPRLESEISYREIRKKDVAEFLGICPKSLTKKLNNDSPFTLKEGLLIWEKWFSDIPIQELFQIKEKDVKI